MIRMEMPGAGSVSIPLRPRKHGVVGVALNSLGADATRKCAVVGCRDPCGRTGGALSTGETMVLRHPLWPFITP